MTQMLEMNMGTKGEIVIFMLMVFLASSCFAAVTITDRQIQSLNISIDIPSNSSVGVTNYIIRYGSNLGTNGNITKSAQDVSGSTLLAFLPNLAAGREYRISVYAVSNTSLETSIANTTAYTVPSQPGDITSTEQTTTTMTVKWVAAENMVSPITYNVTITPSGDNGLISTTEMTANFTGLTAGTVYNVSVVTVVGDVKSKERTALFYTRPEKPQNSSIESVGTEQLTVTWDAPHTGISMGYIVALSSLSTSHTYSQTKNVTTTSANFTGLTPGVRYKATVRAYIGNLQSEPANIVDNTIPLPPSSLEVTGTSTKWIGITWDHPGGVRDTYKVFLNDILNQTVQNSSNTANLSTLTPGDQYVINVFSESNGALSNQPAKITTNAKPQAPTNLGFNSTESSITVGWQKPAEGSVGGYSLQINGGEEQNVTAVLFSNLFSNLISGTNYSVTLKAFSGNQYSDEVHFDTWTKPAAPSSLSFSNETRTSTSFTVSWNKPSLGNVDVYSVTLLTKSNGEQQNITEITGLTKTFTGLYPGRSYKVEVRSSYRTSLSRPESLEVTTKPNPPNDLTLISKTTSDLVVNWTLASGTESSRQVIAITKTGEETKYTNLSKNATRNEFNSLSSGDTYTVMVKTVSGGVESDPVTLTETLPPLAPSSITTTENGIGTDFIEVTWESPTTTKDSLTLTIASLSGASFLKTVNITDFTQNKYKIENLSSGQEYAINLRYASGGVFGAGKNITRTTLPSSIAALEKISSTTTTITVEWHEVTNTTFDIYQLQISPNEGNVQLPINISKNIGVYNFTNLYPGHVYNISIMTVSGNSVSQPRTSRFSTKPLSVNNLRTMPLNTTSIRLNWTITTGSYQDQILIIYNSERKNSSDTTPGEKTYDLTNLKPGYNYVIKVIAESMQEQSAMKTKNETTYPAAVSNLGARTLGYTNISVTWDDGSVNSVMSRQSHFKINYRPVLSNGNSEFQTKDEVVTSPAVLEQLYPGEKYEIQVVAVSNGYESEVQQTTSYTYPKPPGNINLTEGTENSLKLQWSGEDTYKIHYKIRYEALTDGANKTAQTWITNGTEYQLTGLESGVNYSVSIYAVTEGNLESPEATTKMFTTKPVANFTLSEHSDTSSNVVAVAYTENPGLFDYYLFCLDGSACNITLKKSRRDGERVVQFAGTGVIAGELYTVQAQAVSADQHSDSRQIKIRTNPNSVQGLQIQPHPNRVRISWQKPEGIISSYKVLLFLDGTNVQNQTLESNLSLLENLTAYRQYNYRVVAISGPENEKESRPVEGTFNTSSSAPSAVRDFEVIPSSLKPYELTLRWKVPINPNGILLQYNITYIGTKNNVNTVQEVTITNSTVLSTTISNLRAGYTYTFKISARTNVGYGPEVEIQQQMPIWAPTFDESVPEIQRTPRYPDGVQQQTTSAVVEFSNVFSPQNGNIVGYTVIVVETSINNDSTIAVGTDLLTWGTVKQNSGMWKPYEAFEPCELFDSTSSNLCANTRAAIVKRATNSGGGAVQVEIGKESCDNLPPNTRCNGPLRPNKHYRFSLRAKTENGMHADTPFSKVISTKAEEQPNNVVPIVVGVLVAIVLVGVLVGVLIYLRRRGIICREKDEDEMTSPKISMSSLRHSLRRLSHRGRRPGEKASHFVRLEEFPDFVKMMSKDSDFGYSEEYEDLKEVGRNQPWEEAEIPHNRGKNRFTNILPYDHSRVKLLPTDDEDGSDYINANYMPGFSSMREYIVTQGPLPSTVDDFWRMVWEQNCRAIVMLTKCVEKGREKCHRYWPSDSEPAMYGDLQVTILNETRTPEWNISEFKIAKGEQARNLRHFHYTAWPDFGVPTRPQSLIKFVRTVREKLPKEGGPIVVHCSAGVGRSGTFIVLDRLMQHIKDHDSVDIYGVVHQMRGYRVYMVQTEAQYICIHQCLLCVLEGREDEDMNYIEGMSNMGFEGSSKKLNPRTPTESAPLISEKGQDDEGIVEVT